MKVTIDGKTFDTDKAKHAYHLYLHDGHNQITGDLYQSSIGTWYVHTPSQWSNLHSWEIIEPSDILQRYQDYLTPDERDKIISLCSISTE